MVHTRSTRWFLIHVYFQSRQAYLGIILQLYLRCFKPLMDLYMLGLRLNMQNPF